MSRNFIYRLAAGFLISIGLGTASAQCPSFVHKVNITKYADSTGSVLPKGTVVSCFLSGSGLVTAPLGSLDAKLIPNTSSDGTCNSPALTEDGQWILYYGGGKLYIIRIDGQFKTQVPGVVSLGGGAGTGPNFGVCTFWYNAPGSTTTAKKLEVAYRINGNKEVHAIPVTISDNAAPTFGADHAIAKFGGEVTFTMGVAGNHFFSRINTGGFDCPRMATLPATGNATDADLWVPTKQQTAGCMATLSHDGTIAGYNSAYAQWCGCLADQTCNFRHHSLTLVPFQEKTATPIEWINGLVKTQAKSINWAPKKYFSYLPNDTVNGIPLYSDFGADFGCWNYTNNNEYIVGCLHLANYNINPDSLNKAIRSVTPDTGSIWLVHYPTNTWTRILRPLSPVAHNTLLNSPAVWIDPSVGTINPMLPNSRLKGSVSGSTTRYIVDIKGRVVSNGANVSKLIPGVYYSVTAHGVMQRLIIGR